MNNSSNDNRISPNSYIDTKSGSVLALVKAAEIIFAGSALFILFIISDRISQITNELLNSLSQLTYYFTPNTSAPLLASLMRRPLLIPMIILILIMLDGFGVVMIRYGNSGCGLVRFVHTIYWIAHIIEIIYLIVLMFRFGFGMNQAGQAVGNDKTANLALGAMGAFGWIYYIALLIGLLFYCNYHHDIRVVLKTVQEECRTRHVAKIGRNHLAGRCTWLMLGAGLYLVISAVLLFYPIFTKDNLFSKETLQTLSAIAAPMVLLGINFVLTLLSFLKFLSLRICMRNFKKAHK